MDTLTCPFKPTVLKFVCVCVGVSEFPGAFAGLPGSPRDPGSDVCLSLLLLKRVTV